MAFICYKKKLKNDSIFLNPVPELSQTTVVGGYINTRKTTFDFNFDW